MPKFIKKLALMLECEYLYVWGFPDIQFQLMEEEDCLTSTPVLRFVLMPVKFLAVKHKTRWSKWCCGEVTLRGIALCPVFARCVVLKWPFKASPTSVANTFNFPYGNFSHTINGAQRPPYKEGTTWDAWRTKWHFGILKMHSTYMDGQLGIV